MIYILLTVSISVSLLVIFKLFGRYNINTFYAIVVNYLTACITGYLFSEKELNFNDILAGNWLSLSIPLGVLFIGIFYAISLTAQKISIATASVANKMSLIMPALFSIYFFNENASLAKISGILLAILAVILTIHKKEKEKINKKFIYLPVTVFIGSGLIDIAINYVNHELIEHSWQNSAFSISIFLFAFIIGVLILTIENLFKKVNISDKSNEQSITKSILGGICLGIPNYFSIYFILKALETGEFTGAQLFPILNISNVLLSAIIGFTVYREKFTVLNYVGLTLSIVSIFLISK